MATTTQNLSVYRQLKRQRVERLAGMLALVICALVFAILLVLVTGPVPLALGLAALICVVAVSLNSRVGLYLLLFCTISLEQWGIAGLDPLTGRLPFYQTLSGSSSFPLPVSPVEMLLLLTLGTLLMPYVVRRGAAFVRGPLFVPLLLFLAFVVASIAYGLAAGGGAGPFDPRAAWEETRSFFYLAITYVLACNLIQTRAQLRTFVWLFIAAIGLKSAQGIVRFIYVRANGLQVDAITGHEDVVFFSAFVLLLAGLIFFGARLDTEARRQMRVMFVILPPLVFTLLVTNRRLGFVVLAVGLALLAILLLRTRRDLFLRLVPVALAALGIYLVLFWNGTGTLSEPIRAVRSLIAPTSARDLSSNAWRGLENLNIYYNLRMAPVTGLGFGRPIFFIVSQPSLDATGFTYWRFIAHNAIYWVWMKMGFFGFVLFWNLIGSAVVLGLVTFRQLRDGYLKALALTAAGVVLMQVVFSYGDLGLTYSRSMIFLGCMLGMLARLSTVDDRRQTTDDRRHSAIGQAIRHLQARPRPAGGYRWGRAGGRSSVDERGILWVANYRRSGRGWETMSVATRALGNTAIMLVAQLVTWSATLVTTAVLASRLGADAFGTLYLAMSFSLLFSVLVEFGLNQQLVRAIARDRDLTGPYLVNSLAIKLALALVSYAAILALIYLLGYGPEAGWVIAVYCLILACNGLSTTFTAVYQGTQRVVYAAVGSVIEKVLDCILAVVLLSLGFGVIAMAAVFVAGSAASALWQGLCLRRVASIELRLDGRVMIALARNAIPFFAYWVLGSLYYRLDTILLSKLSSAAVLGWYGAAYRLFDTLVFLPSIVASAILFPIMAQLSTQSRSALRRAMGKGLETILIVGIPISVGLFTLAEPIIRIIYRQPDFVNAVPALRWLAIGLLLLYINSILSVTLVSLNEERKMTLVAGLALAVNLALNLVLIPLFQHVGAAFATAATEGVILVYLLAVMPRDLLARSTVSVLARAGAASAAMALVLTALGGQSLVLLIPVGGAVYVLVGLALRLMPPEDIRLIRGALRGRRIKDEGRRTTEESGDTLVPSLRSGQALRASPLVVTEAKEPQT